MNITKDGVYHSFETMLFFDDKLWFPEWSYNKLYYYDLVQKKVVFFCELGEENIRNRLFCQVLMVNGDIYLIPFQAEKMYCVNIESKEVEEINLYALLEDYDIEKENLQFLSAHNDNDVIYMVGAKDAIIVSYECKKKEAKLYDLKDEEIRVTARDTMFCRKSMLREGKIYIPLCGQNLVVVFELETNSVEAVRVGSDGCRYAAICYDGENFWLAPRENSAIVRWNYKEKTYKEFDAFPDEYMANGFGDIVCIKNKIILVPMRANMVLSVDKSTGKILQYNDFFQVFKMCLCCNDNILYLFSAESGKLYAVNVEDNEIECNYINPEKEDAVYYRKKCSATYKYLSLNQKGNCNLSEDYQGALVDYIEYVLKE